MEKDNGQTRWRYRYDAEHRLTDVISQPRDRNKPQVEVSFRYDPLGRRISKTRRQHLAGQPLGKTVTTCFVWEGFRLLQEIHDDVSLTYVYSDQHSYDPLARIDGTQSPDTQLGKNPGPYDIRTRSCLTHVMEVLAAGDVDVPDSTMR